MGDADDMKDSQSDLNDMVTQQGGVESEDEDLNESMERKLEESSLTEIKLMLKQVMVDYRRKIQELEKEKARIKEQENTEVRKCFENLKSVHDPQKVLRHFLLFCRRLVNALPTSRVKRILHV